MENKQIDLSFINKATNILGDTNKGLTKGEMLELTSVYAEMFGIDKLPHTDYKEPVANKREVLYDNLLAFSGEQQFRIIKEISKLPKFKDNEDAENMRKEMYREYYRFNENKHDSYLFTETESILEKYPNVQKVYSKGLENFETGDSDRNGLDDMRLSLELLIKELLGNKKSLENNLNPLGRELKDRGVTHEIYSMMRKLIELYAKFQDDNVKHNDKVKLNEVEYIIDLTSVMIKFLVKTFEKEKTKKPIESTLNQ